MFIMFLIFIIIFMFILHYLLSSVSLLLYSTCRLFFSPHWDTNDGLTGWHQGHSFALQAKAMAKNNIRYLGKPANNLYLHGRRKNRTENVYFMKIIAHWCLKSMKNRFARATLPCLKYLGVLSARIDAKKQTDGTFKALKKNVWTEAHSGVQTYSVSRSFWA